MQVRSIDGADRVFAVGMTEYLQSENKSLRIENTALKGKLSCIERGREIAAAREQSKEQKEEYYKRQVFTKVFQGKCKSLLDCCTLRDLGLMMVLAMHIQRNTGTVIKENGTPMNINDICKLTGESRTTIYRSLTNLVHAEVVYKVKEGRNIVLIMNPAYVANAGYKFLAEANCR